MAERHDPMQTRVEDKLDACRLDRLCPGQLKPCRQRLSGITHPAVRSRVGTIRRCAAGTMDAASLTGHDVACLTNGLFTGCRDRSLAGKILRGPVWATDQERVIAKKLLLNRLYRIGVSSQISRRAVVLDGVGRGSAHTLPDHRAGGHDTG